MIITSELMESIERGIGTIDAKIKKAKKPWIAEAHRHTKSVLEVILREHPVEVEPSDEELEATNEAHERREEGL